MRARMFTSSHSGYALDIVGRSEPVCHCLWRGTEREVLTGRAWISFNVLSLSLFIANLQHPYPGSDADAQSPGGVELEVFMDGWKDLCAHLYTMNIVPH
jgi:hypothetical protein